MLLIFCQKLICRPKCLQHLVESVHRSRASRFSIRICVRNYCCGWEKLFHKTIMRVVENRNMPRSRLTWRCATDKNIKKVKEIVIENRFSFRETVENSTFLLVWFWADVLGQRRRFGHLWLYEFWSYICGGRGRIGLLIELRIS